MATGRYVVGSTSVAVIFETWFSLQSQWPLKKIRPIQNDGGRYKGEIVRDFCTTFHSCLRVVYVRKIIFGKLLLLYFSGTYCVRNERRV